MLHRAYIWTTAKSFWIKSAFSMVELRQKEVKEEEKNNSKKTLRSDTECMLLYYWNQQKSNRSTQNCNNISHTALMTKWIWFIWSGLMNMSATTRLLKNQREKRIEIITYENANDVSHMRVFIPFPIVWLDIMRKIHRLHTIIIFYFYV